MNNGLKRRRPTSLDTLSTMQAQGRMAQQKRTFDAAPSGFARYDAMAKRVGDAAVDKYRRGRGLAR